jgi:hypothetical protein
LLTQAGVLMMTMMLFRKNIMIKYVTLLGVEIVNTGEEN